MPLAVPNQSALVPNNIGQVLMMYSGMETAVIRANLRAIMFCNRDHEAELQNSNTVLIPTRANTVTATGRTRGANWKALEDSGYTLQPMTVDQESEVGNAIRREDMREGLSQLLMRSVADDQGEAHASRINTNLYDAMVEAAAGTVEGTEVGTKGATNAAWLTSAGDIDTAGTGSLDDDFMLQNMKALEKFWIDKKLLYVGRPNSTPDVIMNSAPWLNFKHWVLEQKYADQLNMRLFEGRSDQDGGPVAMVLGMRIWVDDELRALTDAGADNSANEHAILSVAPRRTRAFQAAFVPPTQQFLTPETNQTSPNYAIRSIREWARKAELPEYIATIEIRGSQNGGPSSVEVESDGAPPVAPQAPVADADADVKADGKADTKAK